MIGGKTVWRTGLASRRWRRLAADWRWLPMAAAVLFVILAAGAARHETPTVDEFAHVPAGVAHWRYGQLELYRNNPPLGKLWVAAPLAVSAAVASEPYRGSGTGWEPWLYGDTFLRLNAPRYLAWMVRARLTTIPLVLFAAAIVYLWSRELFGPYPAAVASSLLLLSPSVLAHGHLATVDVAAMTTFAASVWALRWAGAAARGMASGSTAAVESFTVSSATNGANGERAAAASSASGHKPSAAVVASAARKRSPSPASRAAKKKERSRHASTATAGSARVAGTASSAAPAWWRDAVAGAALGLALAVKFSALLLVAVAPVLMLLWAWPTAGRRWPGGMLARRLAIYALAAWLTLCASLGFAGMFASAGSLELNSRAVAGLIAHLPGATPLPLPKAYITGLDALQHDVSTNAFPGYLRGEWSLEGWPSYYFIAYALKETELGVLLTLASLVALLAVPVGWRDRATLLLPPAAFLFAAAFLNSLCLGIRYILPVFPFLFVMQGSVFAWCERRWGALRPWLAALVVGYAAVVAVLTYPGYISYFNRFVGGTTGGARWLVDSNLDWGQDLYRLVDAGRRFDVDRWKLLYFGHVDPALYGIPYEWPSETPEPGMYALSVNYWKGMPYGVLSSDGQLQYLDRRVRWLASLTPDAWAGSLVMFDLRPTALAADTAAAHYKAGILNLARDEPQAAVDHFVAALAREPESAEAHFHLGVAYEHLNDTPRAIAAHRDAIALRPDWDEPHNHLAWHLASDPAADAVQRAEAVALAERACRLNRRYDLAHLDTLAAAYAAAGRLDEARAVYREGLEKATARKSPAAMDAFRAALQQLDGR